MLERSPATFRNRCLHYEFYPGGRDVESILVGIKPGRYAANQPTNALDPDGNLVIFVNGFANKSQQGNSSYWRNSEIIKTSYNTVTHRNGALHNRTIEHAFDTDAMQHFHDKKALYLDGSLGGTDGLTS